MSRYTSDGLRLPTTIFEAAAWHYSIRVSCSRCANASIFDAAGLWWHFHSKCWDEHFAAAPQRFYCMACALGGLPRVRPRRLEAVKDKPVIVLPLPSDRDWKRAVRRFRC